MKHIVIGDIHGRTVWKDIVEKEKDTDKVVFVGDYVDSHDIGIKKQVKNFKEILDYKKKNPDRVVLLFGNHDYHYLPETVSRSETYSGFRYPLYKELSNRIKQGVVSGLFKLCYLYENILISHSGVTNTWCENNNIDLNNLEESINTLFKEDTYSIRFNSINPNGKSMSMSDPYGDNVYQSPIWVRPASLIHDGLGDYIHVVGHTRTKENSAKLFKNVCFTDTLDSGPPATYLVINDTELIPTSL